MAAQRYPRRHEAREIAPDKVVVPISYGKGEMGYEARYQGQRIGEEASFELAEAKLNDQASWQIRHAA